MGVLVPVIVMIGAGGGGWSTHDEGGINDEHNDKEKRDARIHVK